MSARGSPTASATANADAWLSPVSISTRIGAPSARHAPARSAAVAAAAFGCTASAKRNTRVRFSEDHADEDETSDPEAPFRARAGPDATTSAAVMSPSPERSSASEVTARVARRWSPAISDAHAGFPKRARRGGPNARASAPSTGTTRPSTPEPCTTLNSVTAIAGSAWPASAARAAAASTARAIGCVAPRSRFAAMASAAGDDAGGSETATIPRARSDDASSAPSAYVSAPTSAAVFTAPTRSTDAHAICPVVIVPVLSSATAPHSASASSVSPPRTSTPRRAHAPTAATYTSGDMSSAHGAAAERNANARYIAPALPMNGMPNTTGPSTIVASVIPSMALLYRSPNVSSNRETAGRRFCAASVKRAMRAGVECSASRVVRTTSAPSLFTAPAGISSPTRFETGSASPVMCWMETSALPCVTMPSKGTCRFRETFSIKKSVAFREETHRLAPFFFSVGSKLRVESKSVFFFARFAFAVVRRLRWVNG